MTKHSETHTFPSAGIEICAPEIYWVQALYLRNCASNSVLHIGTISLELRLFQKIHKKFLVRYLIGYRTIFYENQAEKGAVYAFYRNKRQQNSGCG